MRCAADSTLSEQQRRQFSATAARAEYRIHPQPRRKSCNGLSFYGSCRDATAYAALAVPVSFKSRAYWRFWGSAIMHMFRHVHLPVQVRHQLLQAAILVEQTVHLLRIGASIALCLLRQRWKVACVILCSWHRSITNLPGSADFNVPMI